MKVSIKDIARVAGVSHSTVSRALASSPLITVQTRQKIEKIAREMGYTPNALARSLVTAQTRTLGIVVTTIEDPFSGMIVRSIEQFAADHGYRVFLCTSHNDPVREANVIKALREWRVDGIIVASSRMGALYQRVLRETGVPIVLINNQNQEAGPGIHSIGVDDTQGGHLATRFLISQGHSTIGFLGGPADYAGVQDRLAGYQAALAEARIPYDPSLVTFGSGRADGGHLTLQFLEHTPPLTALVCYNDMTAVGALKTLKRMGRRVPDQVSIVGFDDIPFAMYTDPPLTTIRQPQEELGREASQMLLDLLNGKQVLSLRLPGRLIVRESTRENSSPALESQGAAFPVRRHKKNSTLP